MNIASYLMVKKFVESWPKRYAQHLITCLLLPAEGLINVLGAQRSRITNYVR